MVKFKIQGLSPIPACRNLCVMNEPLPLSHLFLYHYLHHRFAMEGNVADEKFKIQDLSPADFFVPHVADYLHVSYFKQIHSICLD